MGLYNSPTMKRHLAYSNSKTVACLNLGVLTRDVQKKKFAHAPKAARAYKNKQGKSSYVGTRFLKRTQTLD